MDDARLNRMNVVSNNLFTLTDHIRAFLTVAIRNMNEWKMGGRYENYHQLDQAHATSLASRSYVVIAISIVGKLS